MDKFKLNAEYASIFGAYWMIYAVVGSFASVFMLAKGYTNMHIGTTFAAANLLALAMQPFVADRMDRAKGIALIDAAAVFAALMLLTGTGYFFFKGGSLLLALVIVIILAIHALLQPLLNTLAFRLSESGVPVSFGLGRAGGSLGYSMILAVLGTLTVRRGVMTIPVCAEMACILLIVFLMLSKLSFRKTVSRRAAAKTEENRDAGDAPADKPKDERIDLRDFIRRNRAFFIMNLGMVGLFFSNVILSNYMAQIAGNIGGNTEHVGRILSLMAFSEIPAMALFDKIRKRFSSRTILKVASVGFTAKIAVCWLARSVSLLYASQLLQLVAFALILPGMVYFTDEIMSPGEAVKGQALFTMMITLATIIASFAGGWLLDAYGVKTLTFVSTLITAAGAVIVILTADRVKGHR